MIQEQIAQIINGKNLTEMEMISAMEKIMSGQTTPSQIGGFLVGLRMKGETVEEITGAARVMREKSARIPYRRIHADEPVVDTCGTGGDSSGTFNVSTAAAFVAAGAGVRCDDCATNKECGGADIARNLEPLRERQSG